MSLSTFSDPPSIADVTAKPSQDKNGGMPGTGEAGLATWVMRKVRSWREFRDAEYLARWNEYYRLWRGIWDASDKSRKSERSRIIAPALAEAVDLTHAEITEAVFGRDRWFDVDDDLADQEKTDAERNRDMLQEDMENYGVKDAVMKSIQLGCLYGTGAAKIGVEVIKHPIFSRDADGKAVKQETDLPIVRVYPIDPRELVPDPSASCIDEMLGIAHETYTPAHTIYAGQAEGKYKANAVVARTQGTVARVPRGVHSLEQPSDDAVLVTEYHGKVPTKYLLAMDGVPAPDTMDDTDLTEAVVTIANESVLLAAQRNPFLMGDRSIVAYQHESVPGEFWGRGVAEKGYNPQKALDAEMRMRIDALSLVAAPMMAADRSRLPRGFDMRVYPGKEWPTIGDPSEVLQPINFGNLQPATFDQAAHLEQMVKQATGAMDPGAALSQGARRDTAGGVAMMSAGTVKRSKRTMYNIENQFLQPMIEKVMWRYIQFRPERYQADTEFNVKGAMGIMAREYEQGILSQLYQNTPPESPIHTMIAREIFALSSSPNKQAMVDTLTKQLTPDPEQEKQAQLMKQLAFKKALLEVQELEAKVALNQTGAEKNHAIAQATLEEVGLKHDELMHDAARVTLESQQMDVLKGQAVLTAQGNILKAQQLDLSRQKLELDKRKVARASHAAD